MLKLFHHKFNRYVYELHAGDLFATKEKDVIISTVLGSCIAVCLVDKSTGVIGMNHFMLPGNADSTNSKYGLYSMERLIDDMVKLGAGAQHLTAKIFGGGSLIKSENINVAESNISFIWSYLTARGIPVEASDIGDNYGRRVFFCGNTHAVYLQRIRNNSKSAADI